MLIKSSTICAKGYIYSFALVISSFICFKKITDVSLIIITGVFLIKVYIYHTYIKYILSNCRGEKAVCFNLKAHLILKWLYIDRSYVGHTDDTNPPLVVVDLVFWWCGLQGERFQCCWDIDSCTEVSQCSRPPWVWM